ncbi:MAG: GDSL-type esterase/lipase family protein [Bacteroidota bacterium]
MASYTYPQDFIDTYWTVTDGDIYVSTAGSDTTGNGSPQSPYLTIEKALEIAQDNEKIVIGPDEYVDIESVRIASKETGSESVCRLATKININLAAGGLLTIDGVLTSAGDRVLVWQQAVSAENGIYTASTGPWIRAENYNNVENVIPGKLIPVLEGTDHARSIFQLTTSGTIEVGSIALTFEKTSSGSGSWGSIAGDLNAQTDLTTKISADITVATDNLKDNVPVSGDTLNKLYNLIQGINALSSEDIDTLAEINTILTDTNLIPSIGQLTSNVDIDLNNNTFQLADTKFRFEVNDSKIRLYGTDGGGFTGTETYINITETQIELFNKGAGLGTVSSKITMDDNRINFIVNDSQNTESATLEVNPNGVFASTSPFPGSNELASTSYVNDQIQEAVGVDFPQEIGTIHTENFASANQSDYIENSPNSTFSFSNALEITGGVGNHINYVAFAKADNAHRVTCMEKWKLKASFTTGTLANNTFGFGLGIKSNHTNDAKDVSVRLAQDSTSFLGKFQFYAVKNGAATTLKTSDNGYAMQNNTAYIFEVERIGFTLFARLFDATETLLNEDSYTFPVKAPSNTDVIHNTGRFAVWQYGGNQSISQLEISSKARKNIGRLFIGDSNLNGLFCWNLGSRYVDQVMSTSGLSYEINAGSADTTQSLLDKKDEILAINPEICYINIMSNDQAFNVPQATYQGNYQSFVSDLEAVGIKVMHGTPIARNINLTAIRDFIIQTYAYEDVVDLFEITKGTAGTGLDATFNSGDNIHMNRVGNDICAREILHKLPRLARYVKDMQTIPFIPS